MRKRQKLVLSSLLTTAGMVVASQVSFEYKYVSYVILGGVSWLLSGWSLKEGLSGIEWITVLVPSVVFTISVGMFSMLLPQTWWLQALIIILYSIGQYAMLLSANIFSVAAIRTIALFRAATAVGFAMTILTGFLLYDTILSFRLPFWGNFFTVFIGSIFLLIPALWSVKLEEKLTSRVVSYGVVLSALIGSFAMAMSFWPVTTAVGGLFLTTMLYVLLGVSQHHFQERLHSRTLWEYIIVGVVVLVTMLITAGYGS